MKTSPIIDLHKLAVATYSDVVVFRRYLHSHPELSFEESGTAAYLADRLHDFGIPFRSGIAGHGLTALIEGRNPDSACIALRADMDALPISETNDTGYRSLNKGKMHACGHDVHMAVLLGAASILTKIKDQFHGTVKLIFQPAEEKLPGGAKAMIAEGVLESPEVQAIVGLHVTPELDAGKIGFHSGPFMASGDEINIRINGKGGHAAMPHRITDTVLTASQLIVQLQQIVSRMAPPLIPTVLSFGRVIADGTHNIIPDEVSINGTLRTFDESWRDNAKKLINTFSLHTAEAMGAKAIVDIIDGYPVLINDPQLIQLLRNALSDSFTAHDLIDVPQRMTTEDFAWYSQQIPACFLRLGTAFANESQARRLHSSDFDIDESAMLNGTKVMAAAALILLGFFQQKKQL
ncbi:MAG: M20 family metallopeptidase [Bacteroidales bacterium]|nr:M20 family metallopeptidase [Bacteroidales bacterium]